MLFFAQSAFAQKVKYKDIFALLSSKQYDQAEPFLKRYLQENDDNPNAFLFMAVIYNEKIPKDDVLKQTVRALQNMDSAIFFYDKTLQTIDEKEIKRNKEYYQSYNRRDLRTGEFGVKLSDIQFDLEKKIEGLRARINGVKTTKRYFVLADSLYKKCNALFSSLQNAYGSEREFLLRADEATLAGLSALAVRFDSVTSAFDNYKSSSLNLGKIGYSQVIQLQPVSDFKKDGATPADFYQDNLVLWDYKKFANSCKDRIEKDVMPTREQLVSYDIEINKFREKLNHDSVSVKADLSSLNDKGLIVQLMKVDPDPLPANVFYMKIADLKYKSTLLESKALKDSANVHLQLHIMREAQNCLMRLDSITTKLANTNIDAEGENYKYFITNTYGNTVVLQSYIKALKDYAEREKVKINEEINKRAEALKWIIMEKDSIPLALGTNDARFKPLVIVEEKYTAGLAYTDSLSVTGYFYSITPSRKPDIRAEFAVDKSNFKQARLPQVKALTSDINGQVYFAVIYSERKVKEKYPISVAKIYRLDGLAWSNNYQLLFVPAELTFKPDTGELIIKGINQEISVLDKNGKLVNNK